MRRWENVVVRYSEKRGLDPDFVASVIWKESRGISTVRGPTGAVGLMCVKPFPWRPSAEELENPWTNVAAGTATLAHVLRDGKGDAYYSLAAYNGGWDKIHLTVTRRYAADVLDNYARAVAVEHGLEADGDWIAILSVDGLPDHTTVTVLGPDRPLARYTERPWSRAEIPSVPGGHSPHATLIRYEDDHGRKVRVNLWLVRGDFRSAFTQNPSSTSLSSDGVLRRDVGALPN
ncbi:MAG: transglycosylase SLT domain-containing protein [Anaerolineae bacterium]